MLTRLLFEGKVTSDSENENEPEEEIDESLNHTESSNSTLRYYNPFDFMPNESSELVPLDFKKENSGKADVEAHEEEIQKLIMTNNE